MFNLCDIKDISEWVEKSHTYLNKACNDESNYNCVYEMEYIVDLFTKNNKQN